MYFKTLSLFYCLSFISDPAKHKANINLKKTNKLAGESIDRATTLLLIGDFPVENSSRVYKKLSFGKGEKN